MEPVVARGRPGGQGGYTFVEMMIAMVIAVVVGIGIYGILAYQRRASESQRIMNDLQTGCRFAMDQVKRELSLAGYRAQDTVRPVKVADTNGMAFEYWDERAAFDAPFSPPAIGTNPGYSRHSLVSYRIDGGNLVRTVRRWYQGTSGPTSQYTPGSSDLSEAAVRADFAAITNPVYRQTLATNVDGFTLQYFKQNNEPWNRDPDNNPATPPPFDEIRSVVASLQCRAAEPNPVFRNPDLGAATGERYPVTRLQSEIRLRNVDIATNPRDTTPPAMPTNLRVWDPGECDRLDLAWDANRETDLAGYTIYFGLATGSYSNRVRIARSPGAAGARVSYTVGGLTATKACDATAATYYIRVEAFDKSGNPSTRSAEVSGNPSPSIAAEAGTSAVANDTTVNPAPPAAPTGFVAATPADNQVRLDWAGSPVVGLVGYRLYRSTTGAGFGPVGSVAGTGNCIADERTLGPGALGFLDTGVFLDPAILQGCTAYHYRLAAIHCDGCLPEARMNFASATATTVDATPPPCPTIDAHDGWRRIVLRLENPLRSAVPDYAYTKIWFDPAGYPAYDDNGTMGNADDVVVPDTPIPDTQVAGSPGTFTADGTVTINFDSTTQAEPGPPELDIDSAYHFLAVGFDRCGNVCSPLGNAASRTKGEQCADCLPAEICAGAPPAATGIAATAGCGESLTLSWVGPDVTVHPDFTGFHVYRCPRQYYTMCTDADWTELTSGYVWDPSFTDTRAQGLEAGRHYSYRIRSTDCYYEDHRLTWPASGDPDNDPRDNYSDAYVDNLYIGGVEREERFPGPSARLAKHVTAADDEIPIDSESYQASSFPADAVTGARTIIIGEEVLVCSGARGPAGTDSGAFAGCTRGVGGTSAADHPLGAIVLPQPSTRPVQALCGDLGEEPPSFLHNTVEFWLRNTAAGPLTLTTLSASWQNANAFLERIDLGDGATTPVAYVWSDPGNPLTNGSSGSSVTLANAELYPLDDMIPFALTFRNADRTVSALDNMREELLDVSLGYRNDSTGDASCGGRTTVTVPLGPYLYGTTQNLPREGTVAAAVVGAGDPAMNTILVPGNQQVDVHTNVSDSDYAGIREVRLYYYVDAGKILGAAPPLDAGARYNATPALDSLPPYTRIGMVPVAGNQWRTPVGAGIRESNDANVWYFVVAVDNNGNFDREPESGSGAFQYYQQPYDVCENTPGAPVLSWSTTATTVTLLWTAPSLNTDGTSCTDLGGYAVYRVAAAGGPVKLADLDSGTLTWTDAPPDMDTETYTYYVTARDTCEQPRPKEGPASNWFTECVGASGCTVRLAPTQLRAGDSFSIELFACEKVDGVSGENLYVQVCSGVDSSTVALAESGDSGTFRLGAGQITTWLSEPADAGGFDLRVSADDTVTVHAWSQAPPTGGCGSLTECSASLAVVSDACESVPAPATPDVTVSVAGAPGTCGGNDPTVNLSWSGDDPGGLLFYRVYRCSNANNKTDCVPVTDGSKIYPVGAEPDLDQTARTATDAPGKKAGANRIWYQVEAVSHNGCATSSRWQTAISGAVADNCP